jgi:hypothetical protein
MAGPVRPESGSMPEPLDPLRLGALFFTLRWPRTAHLLITEFQLSREQAWSVAWGTRRHKNLRGARFRLVAKLLGITLFVSPALAVFLVLPLWETFLTSTTRGAESLPLWAAGFGGAIALVTLAAAAAFERYGADRLIDRSIRACWRDRICLWCAHDMDESTPHGDRWAVCPECGMRSPVAVRSP